MFFVSAPVRLVINLGSVLFCITFINVIILFHEKKSNSPLFILRDVYRSSVSASQTSYVNVHEEHKSIIC